jgi:hypothetical protein
MATKSNPVKVNDMAVSGAAPAKTRRKTTTARPKRSTAAAETPVSPIEDSKTEMAIVVSETATAVSVAAIATSDASRADAVARPPQDQIARLAYLYWLDRKGQNGSPEEDWLRAEQKLRQPSAVS